MILYPRLVPPDEEDLPLVWEEDDTPLVFWDAEDMVDLGDYASEWSETVLVPASNCSDGSKRRIDELF